jgi:hypothetical protein
MLRGTMDVMVWRTLKYFTTVCLRRIPFRTLLLCISRFSAGSIGVPENNRHFAEFLNRKLHVNFLCSLRSTLRYHTYDSDISVLIVQFLVISFAGSPKSWATKRQIADV